MLPTAVFALLVDIVLKDRQIVHNVHHRSILIRDHRVVLVVVQTDIMIVFLKIKEEPVNNSFQQMKQFRRNKTFKLF